MEIKYKTKTPKGVTLDKIKLGELFINVYEFDSESGPYDDAYIMLKVEYGHVSLTTGFMFSDEEEEDEESRYYILDTEPLIIKGMK